jgi:hypothetical protein
MMSNLRPGTETVDAEGELARSGADNKCAISPESHEVKVGSPIIKVCMIFLLDNLKKTM